MSKVFDPIRARSSVDALEMIARQHPETAVNVAALREELEAADEQINQLARALREEVEPPSFMGEPVPNAVLGRDGVVRVESPPGVKVVQSQQAEPEDGAEIGVDNDGNAICWNAETKQPYNSGEPPAAGVSVGQPQQVVQCAFCEQSMVAGSECRGADRAVTCEVRTSGVRVLDGSRTE